MDQQQNPRERAVDLVRLILDWRYGRSPVVWTVRIAIVLGILLLIGYEYDTTLWDWLELLIVPAAIAVVATVGGAWFTRQRAQDAALQAYLDKMSELLIDKKLHEKEDRYDDTRITARARTLAVLRELDGERKRIVLLFLREARLINREKYCRNGRRIYPRIVGLREADLENANLRGAKLINARRDEPVSLEGAILEGADLQGADLEGADLRETNLNGANLNGANLSGANLSRANLRGATVTQEQLETTYSLEGATLPGGSEHP